MNLKQKVIARPDQLGYAIGYVVHITGLLVTVLYIRDNEAVLCEYARDKFEKLPMIDGRVNASRLVPLAVV